MKKTMEKKIVNELNRLWLIEEKTDVIEEGAWACGPAFVGTRCDLALVWSLRRRVQGKIFHIMRRAGLPLHDWNKFYIFCYAMRKQKGLYGSYMAAIESRDYYESISRLIGA